jgi:tRNA nucleotidyltransferase (CCA-adding enzyme)
MVDLVAKLKRFFPQELHDRLFLVGGMVRDILMGVECQDIDLLAALPPADLTRLGFGLVQSKSTPNIYFLFHRQLGKIEVTVIPSVDSLPQDLKRRDFAVNAMAMAFDSTVHDPLKGSQDLEHKILRICSPTSFSDDPARIFRAFRFESDGWRLDQAAEAAIGERYWSDDLSLLPVERLSQEMLKALSKSEPGRFFQRMLQFRVGRSYLPEIFRMPEVPAGPLEHHPEGDLFSHSLQVLERMAQKSPEVKARFCAMFHDLGKLSTNKELYPRHHGHDAAGALAADPFCKRLRLPVELQRALQGANKLHNTANRWHELRDSTKIKLALDAGKAGISEILPLLVAADSGGSMPGWEEVLRVAALNSAQLGIDAALLQGAGPEKCQQLIMNQRIKELRKSSQNRHTDTGACD